MFGSAVPVPLTLWPGWLLELCLSWLPLAVAGPPFADLLVEIATSGMASAVSLSPLKLSLPLSAMAIFLFEKVLLDILLATFGMGSAVPLTPDPLT